MDNVALGLEIIGSVGCTTMILDIFPSNLKNASNHTKCAHILHPIASPPLCNKKGRTFARACVLRSRVKAAQWAKMRQQLMVSVPPFLERQYIHKNV